MTSKPTLLDVIDQLEKENNEMDNLINTVNVKKLNNPIGQTIITKMGPETLVIEKRQESQNFVKMLYDPILNCYFDPENNNDFSYLNKMTLDQIAKKLQFLSEVQKQHYKEYQKNLWKGNLQLDEEDHNLWKKTELSCLLILPYYIIIRLIIKQQLNKPQPSNAVIAKIRRVMMVNKGFVPAMILTIFPINALVTYHFKTSYKHFIMQNAEKYDEL